jgi:hypothetical protein
MAEPDYPLALPIIQSAYPTLHFFARYGHAIASVTGVLIFAAGLIAWLTGFGWGWLLLGVAVAGAAYLLLRCFGELVHLIVDTMVPK